MQEEEAHLRKLINITKPANIPELILRKNPTIEEVSSSEITVAEDVSSVEEVNRAQEVKSVKEVVKEDQAVSKQSSRSKLILLLLLKEG